MGQEKASRKYDSFWSFFGFWDAGKSFLGKRTSPRDLFIYAIKNKHIKKSHFSKKSAFTLIELLVIITAVGILSTIVISKLNPSAQINKAQDAQRQQDLSNLKLSLDTYYNDKKCYPQSLDALTSTANNQKPYQGVLPKDPTTKQNYGYATNGSCPQWYTLFVKLQSANTESSALRNCTLPTACGTAPLPAGFDTSWACRSAGKVDCAFLASVVGLGGSGGFTLLPTPTPTVTPTPSPTPTPPPVIAHCADGTDEQTYGSTMVGCNGDKKINEATSLCGAGAHLCTVEEYVARGGATTPRANNTTGRWLATAAYFRDYCGTVDFDYSIRYANASLPPSDPSYYALAAWGNKNYVDMCGESGGYYKSLNGNSLIGATCCTNPPPPLTPTPYPNPVFVGSVATSGRPPVALAISGDYMYVLVAQYDGASSGFLQKYDIRQNNPSLVNSVAVTGYPRAVVVSGNYAYVLTGNNLLKFDIAQDSPTQIGSSAAINGAYALAVSGNYAYVVSYTDPGALIQYDIVQDNPTIVKQVATSRYPALVAVSGNYVYVGSWYDPFQRFDITQNFSRVQYVSGTAISLAASGNYVYIIGNDSQTLHKFDATQNTVPLGSATIGYYAGTFALSGNYLYAIRNGNSTNILKKFDITQNIPIQVGSLARQIFSYSTDNNSIAVSGDYAYVAYYRSAVLEKYNINTLVAPTAPPPPTPTPTVDPHYCMPNGTYPGLSYFFDGDGDNYADPNISPRTFCGVSSVPSGWKLKVNDGGTILDMPDCDDANVNAHPGQTQFFGTPRANGSYDYNCDGNQEVKKPCSDASLAINANPNQVQNNYWSPATYVTWCSGSVSFDNAASLCMTPPAGSNYDIRPASYWEYNGYSTAASSTLYAAGPTDYWLGNSASFGSITQGSCYCPPGNPGCDPSQFTSFGWCWCAPGAGSCSWPNCLTETLVDANPSYGQYGLTTTSYHRGYLKQHYSGSACDAGPGPAYPGDAYYFGVHQKNELSGTLCFSNIQKIGR